MNNDLKNRIDFYRYSNAVQSLYKAKKALKYLKENYDNFDLREIYLCAFYINYAKPFKESDKMPLNLKISNEDFKYSNDNNIAQTLHNKALEIRNKFYAHTDLYVKGNGAKNECFVESTGTDEKGDFYTNSFFSMAQMYRGEIDLYECMIDQFIEIFEDKANNALGQNVLELSEKGYYKLNLNDDKKWFSKTELPTEDIPPPSPINC